MAQLCMFPVNKYRISRVLHVYCRDPLPYFTVKYTKADYMVSMVRGTHLLTPTWGRMWHAHARLSPS